MAIINGIVEVLELQLITGDNLIDVEEIISVHAPDEAVPYWEIKYSDGRTVMASSLALVLYRRDMAVYEKAISEEDV